MLTFFISNALMLTTAGWILQPGSVVGTPYLRAPFSAQQNHGRTAHGPRSAMHKQPFTEEEDQCILEFVRSNGAKNWNQVAFELQTRTSKQCRERWHNHLNPAIEKGPWTAEEDIVLAEKQAILGNKWAEIARFLPGRTDTLVKNRWNTSVKARVQFDGAGTVTLVEKPCERQSEMPQQSTDQILNWLDQFNLNLKETQSVSFMPSASPEWIPPLLTKPMGLQS